MIYQRAFLSRQDPLLVKKIKDCAKQLRNACEKKTKKEVEETTAKMVQVMESVDLIRKMKNFEEEKSQNPEFQVF